jgi:hypothetical protein
MDLIGWHICSGYAPLNFKNVSMYWTVLDCVQGEADDVSERDVELMEDATAGVDILRQFSESNW